MCDRILGLDYGDKTIGVAISDGLGVTAQGLLTLFREDERSLKKSVARLSEIINEYNVKKIVLGYPKNMDNTEGQRCEKTVEFKHRLERNFKRIPVELWDERLSTVAANRALLDIDPRERWKVVDKTAAVYILQGYLDKLNNERSEK